MDKVKKDEIIKYIEKEKEEKNMISKVVPRGTDCAKVIKVIETKSLKGKGTIKDQCRFVLQYWDFKGNLLAEYDPCSKN